MVSHAQSDGPAAVRVPSRTKQATPKVQTHVAAASVTATPAASGVAQSTRKPVSVATFAARNDRPGRRERVAGPARVRLP